MLRVGMSNKRKTRSVPDEPPPCLTPKRKKDSEWRLTDLPALEVARQLTIIEQKIFSEIPLNEYYQARWTKNESPKVEEASCFSNKLSYWLAWLIVREDKIKMRVIHLTYVITLGKVRPHPFASLTFFSAPTGLVQLQLVDVGLSCAKPHSHYPPPEHVETSPEKHSLNVEKN